MWRSISSASAFVLACALPSVALTLAPRPDQPIVALAFRSDAVLALLAARPDAELLWMSGAGRVAVLRSGDPTLAAGLYQAGAILVLAAGPLGGCLPAYESSPTITGATKS